MKRLLALLIIMIILIIPISVSIKFEEREEQIAESSVVGEKRAQAQTEEVIKSSDEIREDGTYILPEFKKLDIYVLEESEEDIIRYNLLKEEASLKEADVAFFYLISGYNVRETEEELTIFLEDDEDFYAEISRLPFDHNDLNDINQLLRQNNEGVTVTQISPAALPNSGLKNAHMYVEERHSTHQIHHILNKFNGQLYKLKIHTKNDEKQKRVLAELFAMVSSIYAKKSK